MDMRECINIDLFKLFEKIIFNTMSVARMIPISNIQTNMKTIIDNKIYINNILLAENLIFTFYKDFIIIKPFYINHNLHHIDHIIDNILHQLKYIIFDIKTYMPICYRENINEHTYLSRCINNIVNYETQEFSKKNISIYINFIGSYIILFFYNEQWLFVLNNNIYTYNNDTYPVLYEHLNKYITKLEKTLCYHIILVDIRTRKIITPSYDTNFVV